MKTLISQEKLRCQSLLSNFSGVAFDRCLPDFDNSLCWEATNIGYTQSIECPFEFCSHCHLPDRFATRLCTANGTWAKPNYDTCVYIYMYNGTCIEKKCHDCPSSFRNTLRCLLLWLSVISALMMIATYVLFVILKTIQCRRLTIHKHLAMAFVIRSIIYVVWILLQWYQVFQGCTGENPQKIDWLCKCILAVIMYSTVSCTFWMFLEGAYLVSRFTVFAMRSIEGHFAVYLSIGWGIPLFFVSLWTLGLEMQPVVHQCWLPYGGSVTMWLLIAPISTALGLNLLFLMVVVGILVEKLRSSNAAESRKIWKTVKATLLLVPLLGIPNLLLFYEPPQSNITAWKIYVLITGIFQHSQGIFVSVLYCFGNSEVQGATLRQLYKSEFFRRLVENDNKWINTKWRTTINSKRYSVTATDI